ncbi:MAG: DinB family protein [Gemmataceae bacterium]
MPNSFADQYRRWFEYETDAHAKVLASLATVPSDRRPGPEFKRAVNLFAHVTGARQIWLFRLGVIPNPPEHLFPECAEFEPLAQHWEDVRQKWADYFGRLTDAELDRVFEYTSFDGGRFRNRIGDVLTQLFGHSWYHRGQIAMLVKQAGGTPAVTDLIYWCREPVI